jgi:membrane protein implicated in regulation of membrane protease activity
MKRYLVTTLVFLSLTLPTAAFAYVGPGAGLSLLGALWGLVAAIGTAIAFIVAWPIRKLLRRTRQPAKDTARPAPNTTNPRA